MDVAQPARLGCGLLGAAAPARFQPAPGEPSFVER
jgi:hypothetical protein